EYGNAWDEIATVTKRQGQLVKLQQFRTISSASNLASLARQIVVYVAEIKKPDAERLNGYNDSQLEELKFYLFSPAPIYPVFEEALLSFSLQTSRDHLCPDDPWVKAIIDGKMHAHIVSEGIRGTR